MIFIQFTDKKSIDNFNFIFCINNGPLLEYKNVNKQEFNFINIYNEIIIQNEYLTLFKIISYDNYINKIIINDYNIIDCVITDSIIKNLVINNNKSLKYLNILKCNIENIKLKIKNINRIELSNNTFLNFLNINFLTLEYLIIYKNTNINLNFNILTNIKMLNLSYCFDIINNFDINKMTELKILILNNCNLKHNLHLNIQKLEYLDVNFNSLEFLDVENCINLNTLECKENKLSNIKISNKLKYIIINNNILSKDIIDNIIKKMNNNDISLLDACNNFNNNIITIKVNNLICFI